MTAMRTVESVLGFEDLPLGSTGSRRALVRWSDGTESEALRWCADEILVCEGDHGNCPVMAPTAEKSRNQRHWGLTWAT
jgi:hypothetical protein